MHDPVIFCRILFTVIWYVIPSCHLPLLFLAFAYRSRRVDLRGHHHNKPIGVTLLTAATSLIRMTLQCYSLRTCSNSNNRECVAQRAPRKDSAKASQGFLQCRASHPEPSRSAITIKCTGSCKLKKNSHATDHSIKLQSMLYSKQADGGNGPCMTK